MMHQELEKYYENVITLTYMKIVEISSNQLKLVFGEMLHMIVMFLYRLQIDLGVNRVLFF